MSDHPREAERNLKRIHVCDDVLHDVFDCLWRAELGLKLATVNGRFAALVAPHLRTKRWILCRIGFWRNNEQKCAELRKILPRKVPRLAERLIQIGEDGQMIRSPLLDVPLPSNFIGFNTIFLSYIDRSVIEFFHSIRHLLDENLTLKLRLSGAYAWQPLKHIWPFVAKGIAVMTGLKLNELYELMQMTSPSILRECANLRIVGGYNIFPESPSYDGPGASQGQALSKWLHTPRDDGHPKVLRCYSHHTIERQLEDLKMAFISAKSPVSYVICLNFDFSLNFTGNPFELDNARTGERMTFLCFGSHFRVNGLWRLRRGPIGWKESEWSEKESRKGFWNKMNMIYIWKP